MMNMKKVIAALSLTILAIGAQAQNKYKNAMLGFELKMDKAWEMKVDTPNMRYHNAQAKAEQDMTQADILENIYFNKDSINKLTVMFGWVPMQFRNNTDSFYTILSDNFLDGLKKSGMQAATIKDTIELNGKKFYKTVVSLSIPNQISIMADVYYWDNKERNLYVIAEYNNKADHEALIKAINHMAATLKEK